MSEHSPGTFPAPAPTVTWEAMDVNAEGQSLPWSVVVTKDPQPFLTSLHTSQYDPGSRLARQFLLDGYREGLSGDPDDKLLWCGFQAVEVLAEATFGSRRSTFAVTTEEITRPDSPYDPTYFAFRDGLDRLPAVAVLEARAFKRRRLQNRNTFFLRRRKPHFDVAVKGLLIVKKPEDVA